MATIAKLVIEMAANPQGVKTGLAQAEGYLRQFGKTADDALKTAGRGASGSTLADNIIGQLQSTLQRSTDTIREQLFRGVLDPQAAATHAREAALAMNATILATLGELRGRGLATPEIEHQLIGQLTNVGLKSGAAMATGITTGVARSGIAGSLTRALVAQTEQAGEVAAEATGRSFASTLTATVHRHRALIPTLAGLLISQSIGEIGPIMESAESKIIATEKAAEKIIESFAVLASFLLDPIPGLIAAVTGGTVAAIIGIFARANEKMAEFHKQFKKEMDGMVNEIDQLGLQKKLEEITVGKRSAGVSVLAPNAFSGGIIDLQARQQRDMNALASLDANTNVFKKLGTNYTETRAALVDEINKRKPVIAELQRQADLIKDAIMNPVGAQAGFGGQLPAVVTKANAPTKITEAKDVAELTSAYKQLREDGLPTLGVVKRLNDAFEAAGRALAATPDKVSKTADAFRKARAEIEAVITPLSKIGVQNLPALTFTPSDTLPGFGAEDAAVQRATTRLEDMRALFGEFSRETSSAYVDLAGLQDVLTQRIAAEGGPLRANLALVTALKTTTEAIASRPKITATAFTDPTTAAALAESAKRAAQLALGANTIGSADAERLQALADNARRRAIASIQAMISAELQSSASDVEKASTVQALVLQLTDLGATARKSGDSFAGIVEGVRGVVEVAAGLDGLNTSMRQVLTSTQRLVEALKAARDAKKAMDAESGNGGGTSISSIVGIAGAGLGILGAVSGIVSAFMAGDSQRQQLQQEQNRLLAANNDKLAELAVKMAGGTNGTSGLLDAQRLFGGIADALRAELQKRLDQINQFLPANGPRANAGNTSLGDTTALLQTVFKQVQLSLGDFSLTFEQFQQIVKDSGIQLFDSTGHLIIPALDQFTKYVQAASAAAVKLTSSLSDQTSLKDLLERVFGRTDDTNKLSDTIDLIGKMSPALGHLFDGLDAATAEGRAKIEAVLQGIATQIASGTLTPEQLGMFTSVQELIGTILGVQDSLDALGKTAEKTAGGLLNVPTGYKVALARFNATDPITGAVSNPFTPRAPKFSPIVPPVLKFPGGGSSGSAATGDGASGLTPGPVVYQFAAGAIVIQGSEKTADELFDEIIKTGQQRARAQFGDSTKWSEVQN